MKENKERFTTGDLSRHFGVSRDQIVYALNKFNLQPSERVGTFRVYHSDLLPAIERALKNTTRATISKAI